MQIVPMTAAYAADIVTWTYPAPYQCYDMTSADPGFLISPDSGFRALIRASFRATTDGQSFQILVRPHQAAG
jgi:hypothetical protein